MRWPPRTPCVAPQATSSSGGRACHIDLRDVFRGRAGPCPASGASLPPPGTDIVSNGGWTRPARLTGRAGRDWGGRRP